jgi:hypothetical protein
MIMKKTTCKTTKFTLAAMVFALVLAAHATVTAQLERSLEGVWTVTTVPRVCATGVPITSATFQALYTFHGDGAISAWTQNNVITTTRTPTHGVWGRGQGWNEYSFRTVLLRYDLSTGAFLGKQEGGATVILDETGDAFTTDGFTRVFNVDGNAVGPVGCANSYGTRFKLEP